MSERVGFQLVELEADGGLIKIKLMSYLEGKEKTVKTKGGFTGNQKVPQLQCKGFSFTLLGNTYSRRIVTYED